MTASANTNDSAAHIQINDHAVPGAIVTGADYRALGALRSLGRHGIPVWVVKSGDHTLAAHSRYASRSFSLQAGDGEAHLKFFLDLSKEHQLKGWLLLPTDDEAVALVSQYHSEFSAAYQIATPAWESLQYAVNKILMHRLAAQLGVAQPWMICPSGREELAAMDCPFPAIVKPAVRTISNPLVNAKAWRVENREELLAAYDKATAVMAPELLMVQEMIPGGGEAQFSYAALCRDGQPLAYLTARRLRQFPMDFGRASTFVESVDEPGLIEPSIRLLQKMKIDGLVEIEYKLDRRDGSFKLLDINPRVWGWHSLCQRAGVDFPYLQWLLVNEKPLPTSIAKAGVRWVRLSSDLPNALKEIIHGRLSPGPYIRSFFGAQLEEAIFARDDVWPAVVEVPLLVKLVAKRLLSKRKI
jgi:predicted ATP-grasp superfamily ATP-dependent carboligase